ncbi:MAG TPA: SDR family NAD(P)-dependent oxidoreductase [Polyangia bacterium]|jgi:NAD(P)-dependent dehydrogenase (short-subunit alcohol dehydrogenase family)
MKTAVITGANVGLGLECAERIAAAGWRVVLACRDEARGKQATAAIARKTGSAHVEFAALDLASLASVRAFAAAVAEPIDALVLNAGVQIVTGRTQTVDGFETTFAVNHLGHFLLANLMLPKMARGGRIIFVSSDTHDPANRTGMPAPRFADPPELARGEDLPGESPGAAGRRRYTTSKLCNVLCAYELDRRVQALADARDVTVNAFDPGFMPSTGLARDYGAFSRFVVAFVLPAATLFMSNGHRVSTSGARLAKLAIDPAYDGVTGAYFTRGKKARSSVDSYDQPRAQLLWNASAAMTGLAG